MSFHLKRREPIALGIRRVAEAELERVRRNLRRARAQESIHDVRKRTKKLRALLRLVRSELDAVVFDRENAAFRDIGRELAMLRDADVLVDTCRDLEETARAAGVPRSLTGLQRHRQRLRREFFDDATNVRRLDAAAAEAASRLNDWTHRGVDVDTIVKGLRRSYGRATDAFAAARRSTDDERWHEWRKRTKDVYYQLELVQGVWPPIIGAALAEYKKLSQSLGVDHDLAIVRQRLTDIVPDDVAARERRRIFAIVDRRRRSLQTSMRKSGKALFDEKPRAFAERFEACFDLWRR